LVLHLWMEGWPVGLSIGKVLCRSMGLGRWRWVAGGLFYSGFTYVQV